MRKATELTGKVFGRLTVVKRAENSRHGAARWYVVCVCGNRKVVRVDQLTKGNTVSCGCYAKEVAGLRKKTHGRTNTFEHNVWLAMRKRCNYEKHPHYNLYGGRGINVCKRWEKFDNFLKDMGECPFERGSIERRDTNKGYTPSNCLWIPATSQSRNRRCVVFVAGDPVEVAAKKHGIAASTLRQRLRNNWPEHLLLKTPQQLGTRKNHDSNQRKARLQACVQAAKEIRRNRRPAGAPASAS